MGRFVDPKLDFAFKRIFATEGHEPILISFLNALIYHGEPVITSLELLNPYLGPVIANRKETYLDIKARLNDGSLVVIEMQMLQVPAFEVRVVYNAAKAYTMQLERGKAYGDLQPVIALTLTNFELFSETETVMSSYRFRNDVTGSLYQNRTIELLFVELPKFRKSLEDLETLADVWLYFMKNTPFLEEVPDRLRRVSEVDQALEVSNRFGMSPEDLEIAEAEEEFFRKHGGFWEVALEKGLEQGLAQGLEQGIQQGLAQGIEQGIQQGITQGETNKALEIARRLLAQGLDASTIAQATGLTVAAIVALIESPATEDSAL